MRPAHRAATVQHRPERSRYELVERDGAVIGVADYRPGPDGVLEFTHTEIAPALRGRGLGERLVTGALDDVRAGGVHRIRPRCSFVAEVVRDHPEYRDLVAAGSP